MIAVIEASMALVPQGKGMKTITNMWISQDQIIHRISLSVNIFMANVLSVNVLDDIISPLDIMFSIFLNKSHVSYSYNFFISQM